MSKVYVVIEYWLGQQSNNTVEAVFSSREKADEWCRVNPVPDKPFDTPRIWTVHKIAFDPECSETSAKVDELIRFVRDVANSSCNHKYCTHCTSCQASDLLRKYGEPE